MRKATVDPFDFVIGKKTFGRWCVGWGFDPVETAATLKEKPVEEVRPAHDAMRRDFSEAYFVIFGGGTSM